MQSAAGCIAAVSVPKVSIHTDRNAFTKPAKTYNKHTDAVEAAENHRMRVSKENKQGELVNPCVLRRKTAQKR